jgi:RNA polymerase sigma-54 factor
MRMSMGLEARQLQTQKLAPRMIQSMEILQLPLMALQERIEQEMNENPLLEQLDVDPNEPDANDDDRMSSETVSESEKELVVDNDHDNADDFERLLNMDSELPSTFDDSFRRSANRMQDDADRQHDLMTNAEMRPESLNDYLLHQLAELDIDDNVEQLAERIISTLDARDGGYLRMPLSDLLPANHTPCGCDRSRRSASRCAVAGAHRHRRAKPARMLDDSNQSGHAVLRRDEKADFFSSRRLGRKSLANHPAKDRLFHRDDSSDS